MPTTWTATIPSDNHAAVFNVVESPHRSGHLVAHTGGSAFFSFNGGQSWQESRTPPMFAGIISGLRADPHRHGRFYVGTRDGFLARSDDGGRSFHPTHSATRGGWITDVAVHPRIRDRVFVTSYGNGGELLQSDDAGATFTPLSLTARGPSTLAISPSDPDVMFVGNWSSVYGSEDGGITWNGSRVAAIQYAASLRGAF